MSSSKPHIESDPTKVRWEKNKCTIQPKGLNIVWGNDPRYWTIETDKEGKEVAHLKNVSWLEVTGMVKVEIETDVTKYKIGFKVSMKKDASGWSNAPVFFMAKFGRRGRYFWKKIKNLKDSSENENLVFEIPEDSFEIIVEPNNSNRDPHIYFGIYEVWSGKWKKGLCIHEAYVQKIIDSAPVN